MQNFRLWMAMLVLAANLVARSSAVRADVLVEIQGAVNRPGMYFVPDNATFADLARIAGGLSPKADRSRFPLASRLQAGSGKLVVNVPFINGAQRPLVAEARRRESGGTRLASNRTGNSGFELGGEWPISGVSGWDVRKFPIEIWVEPLADQELADRYAPAFSAALERWNQVFQELGYTKPVFQLATSPDQALILVRWRRLRKDVVGSNTLGHTVPVGDQRLFRLAGDPSGQQYIWRQLKQAFIELDVVTNNNKFYNQTAMYLIIAHELGHALGVDHTSGRTDLMYPAISVPVDEDQEERAEKILQQITMVETAERLRYHYGVIAIVADQQAGARR